nr:MAG TPA: hypothetical protein [Caudoviricetes sp.]
MAVFCRSCAVLIIVIYNLKTQEYEKHGINSL